MEENFDDLQRLLRLKRHEAPPPEYFEDFLFEFHRRQRAELLRRPLWRLALDRLEGALPSFSPARYAYAGSCALAVGAAALASGHILTSAPHGVRKTGPGIVATSPAKGGSALVANLPRLNLHNSRSAVRLPELNFDQPGKYTASARNARPRYVLDAQPVSYEQPSSF